MPGTLGYFQLLETICKIRYHVIKFGLQLLIKSIHLKRVRKIVPEENYGQGGQLSSGAIVLEPSKKLLSFKNSICKKKMWNFHKIKKSKNLINK